MYVIGKPFMRHSTGTGTVVLRGAVLEGITLFVLIYIKIYLCLILRVI